jgi:hypothetical protein
MAKENEARQTGSGMTDAQGKLQSSRTHARQAAEELKSAAGAIAGEYRGKAEQVWDGARDRVRTRLVLFRGIGFDACAVMFSKSGNMNAMSFHAKG